MNLLKAILLSLMIVINFFEFIEGDEHCVLSLALDSFNNTPFGRKTPQAEAKYIQLHILSR